DKINPPYIENTTNNNTGDTVKKVLLEEFTGHQCPNCPQGAIIAQQLKAIYGEKLILISIHAGDFAEPGTGEFAYDFRSSTGNDINGFFTPMFFPSGMVSRTGWTSSQNNAVIDKNAWGSGIVSIKDDLPQIYIEISNTYNTSTRMVNSAIECDALMDISGIYKICAYLTEDSIIRPQQTPDSVFHNYIHRHVLRGSLNGTWGDTLMTGNTPKNAQFLENCSITLNSAWNENHCYVVAFIYDVANYEIIQVEEKRVK
ncbi:MAG: Omp28 family outer membrane lipoprotein, partial [Bacteroidales bacterium]